MKRSLVAAAALLSIGAGEPKNSPAKVEHSKTGGTITLTPKAVERLAIVVSAVRREVVPDTLVRAGRVVAPPGGRTTLVAPVTGRIIAPPGRKDVVQPGDTLSAGQIVLRILPLIAPDRNLEVEAKRDFELARAQLDMAEKRAARMKTLLAEGAADVAALEQADTGRDVARAELTAAKQRLSRVAKNPLSADVSLTLRAPADGVVIESTAATGQTVTQGAPLLDLVTRDASWVRVPVYVGAIDTIDRATPATVVVLGAHDGRPARIVDRPPVAGRGSAMDIFYVMDKADLVPGTPVSVNLPVNGRTERLVVPWTAIVRDASGAGWVYERTAPTVYVRRRVGVERIVGDDAVLTFGPPVGAEVVTTSVMELFGTETGIGK